MIVRLISGPDAGEIRNLPFIAARGALRSGTAEVVEPEPEPEPEPTTPEGPPPPEPDQEEETEDRAQARYQHHKRAGRRR